jgi:predicted GNAT family acetyltransferase
MRPMNAALTRDPALFASRAGAFLKAKPVEHNVLATTLASVGTMPGDPPLFAWATNTRDEVVAAAMRTPPRNLLASTMGPAAAAAIVAAWLDSGAELPGVNGPEPAAGHLARAWMRLTGGTARRRLAEVIYELEHVVAPSPQPAGEARLAHSGELDLMTDWMFAFCAEAGVDDDHVEAWTALRIEQQRLFVWDCGRPAALAGRSLQVEQVVRIGPVYTPPEERRNGYASALVAAVSGRALEAGACRCTLYADLANQTSNGIYQAIGYRRLCDAAEYTFTPARAPAA